MRSLDQNILTQLRSKIDRSEKRKSISDSIKNIGISKTALAEGKKAEQVSSFQYESNDFFREMEGNDLLNEFINEIEKDCAKKGNKVRISKAYLMFWERLERSNFILETIIENEFNYSQLEVNALIESWLNKYGNWSSYCDLIKKYGFLPQSEMLPNRITKDSKALDKLIQIKLKQCSALLYRMYSKKFDEDFIQAKKYKAISDIYNMLNYSLGSAENIEEAKKNANDMNLDEITEFTTVINFPASELKFDQTYTGKLSKISVDESTIPFLNLDFDLIEQLIVQQIKSGYSVVIASENFTQGINYFYDEMYDLNETMATCLDLDKGKRLNYGISELTAISRIVAFNLDNGKPINWKLTYDNRMITVDNLWLKENAYKFIIKNEILEKNNIKIDLENIIELDDKNPIGVLL